MDQLLVNGRIFDGDAIHEGLALRISGGKIAGLIPQKEADGEALDLEGRLLAPGFVDVQVNGGGGVMFNNDPSQAGLQRMAAAHRRFGTTAMTPTLISDGWDVMEQAAEAVREAIFNRLPGIRGIHFEGPYLNKLRKGVHSANIIREVDDRALSLLTGEGLGRVVTTLAPECVPMDYIRALSRAGVRVCAGHTAATYEDVRAALKNGLSGFTHLYNAMSPLTGREPGVVGSALENGTAWCGIIADGFHVHDTSLRLAIKAKPKGKIMLVTDAMATVGAAEKSFTLYGETILAEDGRCATAEGTLAGSDLDMATAVRNTVRRLNQPVDEALRMASLYPATFLGLDDRIGRIREGYDADLVLLDAEMKVCATWVGGECEDYR